MMKYNKNMSSSFVNQIEIEILDSNIQVKIIQEIESSFNYVRSFIGDEYEDSQIIKTLEIRINHGDLEKISKGLVYGILSGYD